MLLPRRNSKPRRVVLLTGATGLVGQYVLAELLDAGQPVAVLVRGSRMNSAQQRIDAILEFWETRLGRFLPRPKVVEGNLRSPDLGLAQADKRWLADHVGRVLHSAASVRFLLDEQSNEPFESNVRGTQFLLDFAQTIEAEEFHFVSTAYVAGNREGLVLEDELDEGQHFNNAYEESKFQAELLVRQAKKNFERIAIYRPSIVAGDSRDGFTSTFHTVYSALRFARCLPDQDAGRIEFLFDQLNLNSSEQKNIVHVDWLSQAIVKLFLGHSKANSKERATSYHLTYPTTVSTRQISNAMSAAISRESNAWDKMADKFPRIDIQTATQTAFDAFRGYFRDDPIFDRTNAIAELGDLKTPTLGQEELTSLFQYAIRLELQVKRPLIDRALQHQDEQLRAQIQAWTSERQGLIQTNSIRRPAESKIHRLCVSGPGGGEWLLTDSEMDSTVHLSSATLRSIVRNPADIVRCYEQGQIVSVCAENADYTDPRWYNEIRFRVAQNITDLLSELADYLRKCGPITGLSNQSTDGTANSRPNHF